jgi:heme oxygenase
MSLREATAELHSKAEKMTFNQRMFRGELSNLEYVNYLLQQMTIFDQFETRDLVIKGLDRKEKVIEDILELNNGILLEENKICPATVYYATYLKNLNDVDILPHVYLNYLALAYGGQMMKKVTPGSGKMYDFDNMQELVGSIRAIQKDEWANEVNKGFQFLITIFDELQRDSELSSK